MLAFKPLFCLTGIVIGSMITTYGFINKLEQKLKQDHNLVEVDKLVFCDKQWLKDNPDFNVSQLNVDDKCTDWSDVFDW